MSGIVSSSNDRGSACGPLDLGFGWLGCPLGTIAAGEVVRSTTVVGAGPGAGWASLDAAVVANEPSVIPATNISTVSFLAVSRPPNPLSACPRSR